MRQEKLLIPTLRQAPSEAEAISHQLLLRAGFIRQVAAGIYTYLPLGLRVLRKISDIIRQEMDEINAQEVLMPAMQPAELWNESGRYSIYGDELIRFHDRHERKFVLGPTHEEVVTTLIRDEINSYRKLPLALYQIQTKFRDERRPRFGLLRGREFLMKDAYSFDRDWNGLDHTYWNMYEAYNKIFGRCGLNFRPVEADAGAIGGEGGTHEFMALADIGEDTIVTCNLCDYAANLELASSHIRVSGKDAELVDAYEKMHTPDVKAIRQLELFTGLPAKSFVKTLIYVSDGKPIAVLVRGDHEVNETKLKHVLGVVELGLADVAITEKVTGAPIGYAGPIGLEIPVVVDHEVMMINSAITGANEENYHLKNVVPDRDFVIEIVADIRNVLVGDSCQQCSGTLQFHRGIELGHVFKLGTKYSEKLGASYIDDAGKEQMMIMGCYGIGISRMLSAVVEQNYDDQGIIWPRSIAPFQVHLIIVSIKDQNQLDVAENVYQRLRGDGIEVLMDDRDERIGVKFKDSDLIGFPIRIVIGKHASEGRVEYKNRNKEETILITVEEACSNVLDVMQLI